MKGCEGGGEERNEGHVWVGHGIVSSSCSAVGLSAPEERSSLHRLGWDNVMFRMAFNIAVAATGAPGLPMVNTLAQDQKKHCQALCFRQLWGTKCCTSCQMTSFHCYPAAYLAVCRRPAVSDQLPFPSAVLPMKHCHHFLVKSSLPLPLYLLIMQALAQKDRSHALRTAYQPVGCTF